MPPDRGEDNFTIRLKPGSKPMMQPLRHLSPDELDKLGQQIHRLMDKGWISHSHSPRGAPVLFALKKDGGLHCCIDYRALNKMTHRDATPLLNLSELRDRLVNMRQLTNKLLGHKYNAYVISYLDNILIFSTDMSSHTQHVDEVLKTLAEHRLHVKPSKCQWAVDEVEFCDRGPGTTLPDNSLELLSFMGLVNYVKEYIPEYAQITLPLTNLQSGNRPWQWGDEEDKAFNRLKELCSSAPTLAYFDPALDTYLFTDASGYAYGGWLAQPAEGDFPYPPPNRA
ncbi:hypothetical protein PhCBS80983_g06419 [Powellomyces hirtus]|uniref:Reverse transcriptase/retrotransposon-derived protein RNase H-like domain-containing protein n=1 Tax=Powellomyces hirtus TaxID=109895 RepID=A0A507DNY8_9FUNG|nr:hypothetical protein PhCBS80983_g06419 [Powellomyces hirtus]